MPIFTLKGARANANLTQKEVATRLGVSNKTVSAWENGTALPNIQQVNALCELYGRKIDEIDFLPKCSLKADA